jgi:4-amino-4-deoxy-L-arabinose transferase-like glycosyltransferase
MSKHREAIGLCLILLLAACLRLSHLRDNPAWFTDEATHLDIAHHVLEGRWQYLAVTDSVLYFARPPLFELILAGLIDRFGYDILTLRAFTGILGVITVGLLWFVTRSLSHNPGLGLLAAALLAIYPHAVLYSRFGFSYNLLAP